MESDEPKLPDVRCIVWLDGWRAMSMIAHLIGEPTEKQERRDKQDDRDSVPQKEYELDRQGVSYPPCGA
jgi:hypothetical protein